jgi:hypothetical protein
VNFVEVPMCFNRQYKVMKDGMFPKKHKPSSRVSYKFTDDRTPLPTGHSTDLVLGLSSNVVLGRYSESSR